jgi:hypothetical protein
LDPMLGKRNFTPKLYETICLTEFPKSRDDARQT